MITVSRNSLFIILHLLNDSENTAWFIGEAEFQLEQFAKLWYCMGIMHVNGDKIWLCYACGVL